MILTLGTTPAVARSMIFDRVTLDAVNRAKTVRVTAAGKSVNAARVLNTLGHGCVCTGFVGGNTGETLRQSLDAADIRHLFVDSKSETRVCVTVIDRATSQATELIQEAGPILEPEANALLRRLSELSAECTTLLCCGGLASQLPNDFYATAIRAVRRIAPHVRVIIDASGGALAATFSEGVIVKCNQGELAACVNRPIDDDAMKVALQELFARGVRAAVISDGAKATWVAEGTSVWRIASPKIQVVSAIGSGDSMAAGLAAGLETGASFIDAARLGVACGAANAQTPTPGEIDPAEVDRLLKLLHAEQVQ